MNFRKQLVALLATAGLFGCNTASEQVVTLPLIATPQNRSQIATVTLASQGNQTAFSFFISGVPNGVTLPLHIYTFVNKGSCQQPGPVAYAMNDRINTQHAAGIRGWTYSRIAPVAMRDLLSGEYSLVVR
ncbi:MAG TPA: hypothetical protein DIW52_02810, partial [Pseudomonas sp.]|nr:hypothetical protein [Pseudomonas sp.]